MESLYQEFKGRDYLEQWERVHRWYEKLLLVKCGYYKEYSDRELLDIVYSYFMNVQHLKDWVFNFPDAGSSLHSNLKTLQGKQCFVVCADFINNHKHFKRSDKSKFADSRSSISQQNVKIGIGALHINHSLHAELLEKAENKLSQKFHLGAIYSWNVTHLDQNIDVYDLAKECLSEWDKFLTENELL